MENEQKTAGKIKKRAEELFEQIREDRRYLHQIPEIGTDVPQTTAYICRRLDDMGIPWQSCGGPLSGKMTEDYISAGFPRMERATGVTAVIGNGGPCILLRAEMDAPPIKQENDWAFRSEYGYGHMFGHDTHAAMLPRAAPI